MINRTTTGIRKFVIAGNGLEAWLAANHLLASLGGRQVEITVCPGPGSDRLDGLYCVWPMKMDDGLAPIKLSVKDMVQACRSSFSLGTQHKDLFRPYGNIGQDYFGAAFHHYWLRNRDSKPALTFGWPGSISQGCR